MPVAITSDSANNIYVADNAHQKIYKIKVNAAGNPETAYSYVDLSGAFTPEEGYTHAPIRIKNATNYPHGETNANKWDTSIANNAISPGREICSMTWFEDNLYIGLRETLRVDTPIYRNLSLIHI